MSDIDLAALRADLNATLERMQKGLAKLAAPKPEGEPNQVFTFKAPPELSSRIYRFAYANKLTQAEALRRLIEQGLAWEASAMIVERSQRR